MKNIIRLLALSCAIFVTFAYDGPTCPATTEFSFIFDQSENARTASSDNPRDDATKFNILEAQLRLILNTPVLQNSDSVRITAYGYSAGEYVMLIPYRSTPKYALTYPYPLRQLVNSGSWTATGLNQIVNKPYLPNSNVLFLVSSQGSSSEIRRQQAKDAAAFVRYLGWNLTLIAMTSLNPFDTNEFAAISQNKPYISLTDTSTDPKSYRLLSKTIIDIINSICTVYPFTTNATAPTTTTTTTTTTPTTTSTTTTTTTTTKPTTITTKAPLQTPPATERAVDGLVCSQCRYEAGFNFDSDPEYCDTFYQCIPDTKPIKKHCPAGTFWDGNQCNFINAVQCPKAACNSVTQQNFTYPSGRCCNKFYECYNSKLYERQCPIDNFYDATAGKCVYQSNRVSVCEQFGKFECDVNRQVGVRDCSGYSPDPFGDPCKYQFSGNSLRVAPGTIWIQAVCSLVTDSNKRCSGSLNDRDSVPYSDTCGASFLANFNAGSKVVYSERTGSNIDVYIIQREVLLQNNALYYNNSMSSPLYYFYYFNNKDMNVNTAFKVRFNLQDYKLGSTYDILSNSYCSLCPDSIRFTVTPSATSLGITQFDVTAIFVPTQSKAVEAHAIISNVNPSNWLEMIVVYGDVSVYGKLYEVNTNNNVIRTVDFVTNSKTQGVHIALNKCGIQLGKGSQNHFVGLIDEFAVYENCKSIDMAFRP